MHTFADLKKANKNLSVNAKKLSVALLCDTPSQWLAQAIGGAISLNGFEANVWEAGIGQLSLQALSPNSELKDFNASYVVVHNDVEEIHKRFYKTSHTLRQDFAANYFDELKECFEAILSQNNARLIVYNFPLINDGVMGQFANKFSSSYLFQLHKLNMLLMEWAVTKENAWIADLVDVYSRKGSDFMFAANLWATTGLTHSIDALPFVAKCVTDIIAACEGRFKKCIVLDLDDTLWGGTIGDDGWENLQLGSLGLGRAYSDLQRWCKALQERGIIVCVCSKNDEAVAKSAFQQHPDMLLKLEDIAVFVANWDHKPDNLRLIQRTLNIGLDSMVFVDNSKYEREMVRSELPDVTVPELPDDASEYVRYLQSLNLFETPSLSEEDRERTARYRQEATRDQLRESFTDATTFLQNLKMLAKVESFTPFNTPRVAQLTQRSNQFNLRTQRYDEAQLKAMQANDDFGCFAFSLNDRFGDYGLISVVILRRNDENYFIDTWLMSCRVLNRGVEEFVLNSLVDWCKSKNANGLVGEFIPTSKNNLVKDLLPRLGFVSDGDQWMLDVNTFQPLPTTVSVG